MNTSVSNSVGLRQSRSPEPLPQVQAVEQHHSHRRFFLGPLPEKIVSTTEGHLYKNKNKTKFVRFRTISGPQENGQGEDALPPLLEEHAFNFFVRDGGDVGDWGEDTEANFRRLLTRRWQESEWGRILSQRQKQLESRQNERWVGSSFEIGNLLGMNVLVEEYANVLLERLSMRSSKRSPAAHSTFGRNEAVSKGTGDTFVTAQTEISLPMSPSASPESPSREEDIETSSSTQLIRPTPPRAESGKAQTDVIIRPTVHFKASFHAKSDAHVGLMDDSPQELSRHAASSNDASLIDAGDHHQPPQTLPAPPGEVLERTGSAVQDTSAGAARNESTETHNSDGQRGDVVLRGVCHQALLSRLVSISPQSDRMLVRVSYTRSESLGSAFDEAQHRLTRNLQYEDWAEFMVVWRRDRLELYEDYALPLREWLSGHKHLIFVIPLKPPSTRLSVYSYVDLTFCLTSSPADVHATRSRGARALFGDAERGTDIFIFKVKSRSRAQDWIWKLWRKFSNKVPPALDVRCPELNAHVHIDLPDALNLSSTETSGYQMFTRDNVIRVSSDALSNLPDWTDVIAERMARQDQHLELQWRLGNKVDWIWHETDVQGQRRDWAVLYGLALRQSGKYPRLEIHLRDYGSIPVHLSDDSRLEEPPDIEGYLCHIRPVTQTRQGVYISTHDGNIFSLAPANAHPPAPPGLQPQAKTGDHTTALRTSEVQRGISQIMQAKGVLDLRNILAVRRSFEIIPSSTHSETNRADLNAHVSNRNTAPASGFAVPVEETDSDDEDEGGDDVIAKSHDKSELRMKRSFELLLTTGQVVRFEAHSRRVAIEWIDRLRTLALYWNHRHRVDAQSEMQLAELTASRPPLTPHIRAMAQGCGQDLPPDVPPDKEAYLPGLSSLYNWCVLDGCRPILKGGKLFMRKGFRGQYRLVHLFLVSGHLVPYDIKPASTLQHRQTSAFNLLDAYVCSGYFAALALRNGEYDPTAEPLPRRYQDGLEADDPDEDTLFIIWYRQHAPAAPVDEKSTSQAGTAIPSMSTKWKTLVFRTRSMPERDAWCWALSCEIERVTRTNSKREERMREQGGIIGL